MQEFYSVVTALILKGKNNCYRACANNNFKIDALQKVGQVLQITPESYIKDERNLKIINALNSSNLESEKKPNMESINQLLEEERKHHEEEISYYRKQIEVKDRQIEYLMKQLDLKDDMYSGTLNILRDIGIEQPYNQGKRKGVDQK